MTFNDSVGNLFLINVTPESNHIGEFPTPSTQVVFDTSAAPPFVFGYMILTVG